MLEVMAPTDILSRFSAFSRPHTAPVNLAQSIKKKEEIEAEEEFFDAEDFLDNDLPEAPNGESLQVIARSMANEYINSLVGNYLIINAQTKAKKAVAPEIWTIGQTQKLVDTFKDIYPLLSKDWPLKSKASDKEKEEIIALFTETRESLEEIENTLKIKITQASFEGKSESDNFGYNIFTVDEIEKLTELPSLLQKIQNKSKGLYTEGDTLSKRTYIALTLTCASLLAMITGIVLSVLSGQGIIAVPVIVAAIPSIVAAVSTLANGIATYLLFLQDTKNKQEAKSWAQDIEGLTNLSDELKKLKESEMSEVTLATLNKVNQLAQLMVQTNDELVAIRKDVAPLLGRAVGRKGSNDSLSSASSGHDSGVDVKRRVGAPEMSPAKWKAFKSEQKELLREKALILRSELLKIKGNTEDFVNQIFSLLISEALHSTPDKLYTEIVENLSSQLEMSEKTETALFRKGEPYFVTMRKLKNSYEREELSGDKIKTNLYKHSIKANVEDTLKTV